MPQNHIFSSSIFIETEEPYFKFVRGSNNLNPFSQIHPLVEHLLKVFVRFTHKLVICLLFYLVYLIQLTSYHFSCHFPDWNWFQFGIFDSFWLVGNWVFCNLKVVVWILNFWFIIWFFDAWDLSFMEYMISFFVFWLLSIYYKKLYLEFFADCEQFDSGKCDFCSCFEIRFMRVWTYEHIDQCLWPLPEIDWLIVIHDVVRDLGMSVGLLSFWRCG